MYYFDSYVEAIMEEDVKNKNFVITFEDGNIIKVKKNFVKQIATQCGEGEENIAILIAVIKIAISEYKMSISSLKPAIVRWLPVILDTFSFEKMLPWMREMTGNEIISLFYSGNPIGYLNQTYC